MVKKICYSCTNGADQNIEMFICNKCSDNKIYKSSIIKNYKLDDIDLQNLPSGQFYYKKNLCIYYYKPHIIEATTQKYGPNFENLFMQYKNKKQQTAQTKKEIRENKIILLCQSNNIDYEKYKYRDEIMNFISNGKNINNIMNKITKIDQRTKLVEQKLIENRLVNDGYYCKLYIDEIYDEYNDDVNNIISNIDNLINQLKLMKRNKSILEIKLMINGLVLRPDSRICNEFINGSNAYSLDKIVSIMKEMEFLYKHTNYSDILRNTRYEYIKDQRQTGWYNHSDMDEEYVRNEAKKKAFNKCKNKPDFNIVI